MRVKQDWDRIRRYKWSSIEPPPEWDQSLRPISIDGVSLFALDDKGNLYWDGQPVETRKRIALTWPQTIGAFLVGLCAIAGGIGGAVQGAITYHDWSCKVGWPSLVACPTKDISTPS
jgi:hypothetical protein